MSNLTNSQIVNSIICNRQQKNNASDKLTAYVNIRMLCMLLVIIYESGIVLERKDYQLSNHHYLLPYDFCI